MHSLRFRKIYRTSSVTGFELAWKTASTRSVTDEKGTKKNVIVYRRERRNSDPRGESVTGDPPA